MTGPTTRGKKNVVTPRKSPDKDEVTIEDTNPNEEIIKVKEDTSLVKMEMCGLRGDISNI